MILELPVIDLPSNLHGKSPWRDPSMQQSLSLQLDVTHALHVGLGTLLHQGGAADPPWYGRIAIAGLDVVLATQLPLLSGGWLHEEWHRSVMTHHDVSSRNGFYDFDFSGPVPADRVDDDDLIRFKREHPADYVRMSAAGNEAQTALVERLARDRFFRRGRAWNRATMWNQALLNIVSLWTARSAYRADYESRLRDRPEWTDVSRRDFTGLDTTAWVYDLHRPDEPYEGRGPHPSGIGINRYRFVDDLTPSERRYLDRTAWLSLANVFDPMLFGLDRFTTRGVQWNLNLRHTLAAFGNNIDIQAYLATRWVDLALAIHVQDTPAAVFPGATVDAIRWRPSANVPLVLSSRTSVWQQPERQRFDRRRGVWGGQIAGELAIVLWQELEWYAAAGIKSAGWVAGDVELDAGLFVRAGLRWAR